jgi:hypothetical protein
MTGRNQNGSDVRTYTATAAAVVSKSASGIYAEPFAWSDLIWNGQPVALLPDDAAMRETLSLDPEYRLTVPNLSKVNPRLIGPITDLLTFYADLQIAARMKELKQPNDHVFFKHGTPSSWADGQYFIIAEDAIDFDITLRSVDAATRTATLIVKHVPPAQLSVKLPAAWMQVPIATVPNNWVEVAKQGEGSFDAEVGAETFEVELKVSMEDGRLLSAHMENPVDVVDRHCKDAALTDCSESTRFKILRQISIE